MKNHYDKNGELIREKNEYYGTFRAEYCRATGLPMYEGWNYSDVANKYLSKTRC